MNALQAWQERLALCREERSEGEGAVWQRLAAWYNRWVESNDYVSLVLPRLQRRLPPNARVLEVGPGTGAFTLPLARLAGEVVAVEPSANMLAALGRNLDQAGLHNVRLVPQPIEEALGALQGPFDLALAANSLYNVEPIDDVVRSLVGLARHTCILIGTGEKREWYQALQRRFRGRERLPAGHFGLLYPVLLEMGLYADVEILYTTCNYVYDSEEALVEWWAGHLGLGTERRVELRTSLLPLAERRDGQVGIYSRHRLALVSIEAERNLFAPF